MDLFFSPFACSLASRISLYEAGAEDKVAFRQVNVRTKRTVPEDEDFRTINPIGMVPVLRTDDGRLVQENLALLCYIADRFPEAGLGAADADERYELLRWLSFVSTELHKQVFTPLFNSTAGEGARDFARASAPARLALLEAHLAGREFLLSRFSVADALLVTALNWAQFAAVDLSPYPAVSAYYQRISARPAVARAMRDEAALR